MNHEIAIEIKTRGWIGSPGHATFMLLISTVLWGISFPIGTHWQHSTQDCPGGAILSTLTFLGLRLLIALPVMAVCLPHLFTLPSRRELLIGSVLGLLNFLGVFLQTLGQAYTSPAISGFLTAMASAWVPLMAFCFFRIRVAPATIIGIILGITGVAILQSGQEIVWQWGGGEVLTLLSSIDFAVIIVLLDRLGKGIPSDHLSIGFIVLTGLPAVFLAPILAACGSGLPSYASWLGTALRKPELLADVLLLAFLCTLLAYYWMMRYQPRVPASRAALIYLVEPVWAAGFSLLWGLDSFSDRLLIGGSLILGGNLLVELRSWLRRNGEKVPEGETT